MPFPNLDGRPTKYDDSMINKIKEYVEKCISENKLPTRAGLANFIVVTKQTLINWGKENKQFLDALQIFDELQEDQVWDKALKGEYNSNIAKLLLHNHGYSDRVQADNTNTNLNMDMDESLDPEARLQGVLQRIKQLREQE